MDIRLQRAIDRYAGTFLCRILGWLGGSRKRPAEDFRPQRILVILLSEMGSLVQAVPMFRAARERYPEASFHVLLFAKNREILDLLRVVPPENLWLIDDTDIRRFVRDSLRLVFRMRRHRFDTVIDCELFARVSSILSRISGAAVRAGFHRHTQEGLYRGDFINRPVLYNPYRHISLQFMTLLDAIGSTTTPRAKEPPSNPPPIGQIPFPPEEIEALKTRLEKDFPVLAGRRIVLINPGGGLLPIRAWPLGHYCRLAEKLLARGYAVAVTGMAADRGLAKEIVRHGRSPLCVDLTGYTRSIRELLLLFHRASLLVSNDGGPGHFALLTPIRSILFFGPETPVLYGPPPERAESLFLGLPCSPCLTAYNHRNSPCDGDNRCLKGITPETVLGRALLLLNDPAQTG